jgi:TPR repeat protein/V8-like Glu-specific endopeptidase
MRPPSLLIAALLVAAPATAQDLIGFDISSFGKTVLSRNQVAGEPILEAAFGAYNNEFMSAYSPQSIFARIGKSVGRLDVATDNGVFPCTAFLVDDDLLMTNNHCVPGITENARAGASAIVGVQFVMGYIQEGVSEGTMKYLVDPTPVETSKPLDYTLLRILGDAPGRDVGALRLAAITPNDNDPYWIIGHPMGEAQRISREKCRANAPALSDGKLLHTCDTMPGNSGSPVIDASSQRVIGLHHAGSANNSVNYAVPMERILAASPLLSALVPPAPAPVETPEASGFVRLSEALAVADIADRITALEGLIADFPGTSAARTAGQLIATLAPAPPPDPVIPDPVPEQPDLAQQMAAHADVQACDALAGDSFHPDRARGLMLQNGVRFEEIDAVAGLAACMRALDSFPDHPRMTAFMGEALAAADRNEEALAAYRNAAEAGDAIGQAGLGIAHLHGYGTEVSYDISLDWLTKSADQGYPIAQAGLAVMYKRGLGVPQSDATALDLYTQAAERGYHGAQVKLGDLYIAGQIVSKSAETAAFWYAQAAGQGDALAQYNLGNLHAAGEGVPQSDGTAAELYRRAAEQGNAAAQVALGTFYFQGRGVEQSDSAAADWFTHAAALDNAIALISLAWMAETGRGVAADPTQAAELHLRALKAGSEWAATRDTQDWPRDTARALQRALAAEGAYSGPVSGQIGAKTQEAMRSLLP